MDTKKSRERLCLEKMMQMLADNKRIELYPDWGQPYTLYIIELDEEDDEKIKSVKHTHSSYYLDEPDNRTVDTQKHLDGVVESFIDHILGDQPGCNWFKQEAK